MGKGKSLTTPAAAQSTGDVTTYLPLIANTDQTPPPPPPPLPPPIPMTGIPPIDFAAVRQTLQEQELELAFNKIGFHYGSGGGNTTGLNEWITQMDAAGIPIFLKGADSAEFLYAAQQLMKVSSVPHTLVFRRASPFSDDPTYDPNVPDYNKTPKAAALEHWEKHKAIFPAELDPSLVWIETINEVDKNRSEWLAEFALETAKLTMADGFKWVAFGWSSGEPEPEHWESAAMLRFLQLVADNPDKLAIGLHEYSYRTNEIDYIYPYLIGRFQHLFEICDAHNIPRPPIVITEWGWEYDNVPTPAEAILDIQWAAWLYAAYPQVKGAAIWYLGPGFAGIAEQTQQLIAPVTDYSLSHYFAISPGRGSVDTSIFEP